MQKDLVAVHLVEVAELFQQLLKSSFNVEILTRDRLKRQFACAAQLAMRISGHRLHLPDGLEHLAAVRARIVDCVRRLDSTVTDGNRQA